MGGALMELVAKGSQDLFLTGNPSVTYFKNVYKKHTNFSYESIQQSIVGNANFGNKIECVISRTGDLLTGIIIEIDLPKIEGKRGKSVSWINSIGHYLLKSIELQIGGNKIDKHYGEWLEIWNELTISESHKTGYYNMIGKNISITDKKTLIIPLQFWFCRNYGLALPLIALQFHEVKLIIELNDFSKCWKKDYDYYYLDRIQVNNKWIIRINENVNDDDVKTIFNDSSILSDGSDIYNDMKLLWVEDEEINTISNKTIGSDDSLDLKNFSGNQEKTGYAYLLKNEPLIMIMN